MASIPAPSVVIRADELIDGIAHRRCPKCGVLKPLDGFGLRNMRQADGSTVVREQAWCRECRSSHRYGR